MCVLLSQFSHGRLACADQFWGVDGMGLSDDRVPALGSNIRILKHDPENYLGTVQNNFMHSLLSFTVQLFLPDFA
jgi:hypothetical protein